MLCDRLATAKWYTDDFLKSQIPVELQRFQPLLDEVANAPFTEDQFRVRITEAGLSREMAAAYLSAQDQQLKLLDRVVELLGGAAETRAAQHRQLHLQLLDM